MDWKRILVFAPEEKRVGTTIARLKDVNGLSIPVALEMKIISSVKQNAMRDVKIIPVRF